MKFLGLIALGFGDTAVRIIWEANFIGRRVRGEIWGESARVLGREKLGRDWLLYISERPGRVALHARANPHVGSGSLGIASSQNSNRGWGHRGIDPADRQPGAASVACRILERDLNLPP